MKNFPIIHEGKEYWISRSITVCSVVITFHQDEWFVLINKRGEGTPDYQGYYNLPCGYLDYDETILEAAIREIHEETGIDVSNIWNHFMGVSDNPSKDKRQNISFRYLFVDTDGILKNQILTDEHSESNEVSDIKWIRFSEIDNHKWAFNHDEVITETLHLFAELINYTEDKLN